MIASDKKKSFGEWLKFLEYREKNKDKVFCKHCGIRHPKYYLCVVPLLIPYKHL